MKGSFALFQVMKDTNVRCSVIGLAAEIRVCKKLCIDTNGLYIIDKLKIYL
jgi:hypothetical protein